MKRTRVEQRARLDGWRGVLWPLMAVMCLAAGTRGSVVVSEVMYDPASTNDGSWEYIEVVNMGGVPVDLSTFILDDDSGTPLSAANIAGGVLDPGAAAVLHNASTLASELDAAWLGPEAPPGHTIRWIPVSPWPGLTNSGEHFGLWRDLASYGERDFATAEDELSYTAGTPWPTPDGAASIFLTDPLVDNSLGANWGLSQPAVQGAWSSQAAGLNGGINVGSPGVTPGVFVPEPAGLTLAALGALGGWGVWRRRQRLGAI